MVKDPRLSWFLGLWRVAAVRTGATPVFATMLRPPAEVVGSKQTYYANRLGSAHLAASLAEHAAAHRARHPRVRRRRRPGLRPLRRPARRLGQDDACTSAETLQLQHVLHADSEQIRDGHRFVDPGLRRMSQTLEDLDLPPRLHELTARHLGASSTSSPTPAATPPTVHAALDQLREAYVDLYEESAAISRSSVVAAEQRAQAPGQGAAPRPRRPPRGADRSRTALRAAVPPSRAARRCARLAGRERPDDDDPPATGIQNLEGHTEFDITWPWTRPGGLRPGTTAVLRVKDEARIAAVGAAAAAAGLRPRAGRRQRLDRRHPRGGRRDRRAGRARGQAHARRRTPSRWRAPAPSTSPSHERSVHSLAYFYNWCFAQVQTRYSWKWDGDMVLTTEGEVSIGDLGWQVGDVQSIIRVPRHGLYLESDSKGYLDLGLRNAEEWGFPIGPDFVFTKAYEWEIRTTPDPVRSIGLPHGLCVELKYLDGDEFAHWTDPASFATSYRNKRKRREWTVYNALLARRGAARRARDHRSRGRAHRRPRHPRVAAARAAAAGGRAARAGARLPGPAGPGGQPRRARSEVTGGSTTQLSAAAVGLEGGS